MFLFRSSSPEKYILLFHLLMGIFVVWLAVTQTWGHLTLSGRDSRASVFEGVGRLGRRRLIDLRQISDLTVCSDRTRRCIALYITGDDDVSFGRYIKTDQLIFLAAYLLRRAQALGNIAI